MNRSHRPMALLLVLILLLGGFAAFSGQRYLESRAAVATAADQLAEVRHLAGQVKHLRDRPVLAGAQEMELTDLAQLLEQAADHAKIERSQLDRIWPEAARRVGESDYQEKPTQVVLRQVNLEQLMRFMHAIAGEGDQGLTISSLRLIAPRDSERDSSAPGGTGESGGRGWTAELTITYLIYAPRERGTMARGGRGN